MIDIDGAVALPPGRLHELITAVFLAQPADECDWAEWKSNLDLTTKHGQFSLARSILGFANRNPETCTTHLGGTAYILVGVEPGKIRGVTPIDAADLQPRLAQYLGSPEPFWRHHYVPNPEHPDRPVLVIEVPPPRQGETFYPLAREGVAGPGQTAATSGTIFIRRGSKTERANYAEMIMLRNRVAQKGAPIKITEIGLACQIIASDDPPFRSLDLTPAPLGAWLEMRRKELIKKTRQDGLHLGLNRMRSDSEIRTHSRSVDAYLEESRPYAEGIMTAALIAQGYNGMTIHIDNPSNEHLIDTEMTLTLPRGCTVIDGAELDPGAFPPAPGDSPPDALRGHLSALRPATPRQARVAAHKNFVNIGATSTYTEHLGTIGAQSVGHTCTVQVLLDSSLDNLDLTVAIRSTSLPGVERLQVTIPVSTERELFLAELVDPNPAAPRRPRRFPVTHQHRH